MLIQQKQRTDLVRIASFILFDALVFHECLSGMTSSIRSLSQAGESRHEFLATEWTKILEIDYDPVFGIALEILRELPSAPTTEQILGKLIRLALRVVSTGTILKHDFMGRLYHKLLLPTARHYYATYYTSVPAAWLLAHLSIKTPGPEWTWEDNGEVSKLRVIDPACGSGTLLSATYMAIKDRVIHDQGTGADLGALHKSLIEHVLHGWDILDYATHLTLTTLALHSTKSFVRDSHVYVLPAGMSDGAVYLGSLDHLRGQRPLVGRGFGRETIRRRMEGAVADEVLVEPYDLVIMNPPFSRSAKPNVKFGYAGQEVKKRMNQELSVIGKAINASGIGQAGLGAYFMLLALKLAGVGGRIAVVIPRSMLSGVSWRHVRKRYLEECEIEYIISNYDPGGKETGVEPWSWSENTDLGEVLIIARKTDRPLEDRQTLFVNAYQKPRNEVESLLLAHDVLNARATVQGTLGERQWAPIGIADRSAGCAYFVPQARLYQNWVAPCVFAQPDINAFTLAIEDSLPGGVGLDSICDSLGVDIKQVKDHFVNSREPTRDRLVWGHQGAMMTIALDPTHVGYGRPKKPGNSERLFGSGSARLLLAERPHLSTERLLAMLSPVPVLTTAFWELRPKNPAHEAFLLLWFNSSYGFLTFLAVSTSSMGDIFKAKKQQLESLQLPSPDAVSVPECEALLSSIRGTAFEPFGLEFERASRGRGPRFTIDEFFRDQLHLPAIGRSLYELLAKDPVVRKWRL